MVLGHAGFGAGVKRFRLASVRPTPTQDAYVPQGVDRRDTEAAPCDEGDQHMNDRIIRSILPMDSCYIEGTFTLDELEIVLETLKAAKVTHEMYRERLGEEIDDVR